MKTLFTLLISILVFVNVKGQIPVLKWDKNYNGPVSGTDRATGADFDPVTGSTYVIGVSDSTTGFNYVTIKYSSSGQEIWRKRYSGPQAQDSPNAIKYDPVNNSVYVTGKSKGSTSNFDWLTIRYNATTGDTIWTRRFNGNENSDDEAIDLDIDAAGNVYVLGNVLEPCSNHITSMLIKYSFNGNFSWDQSIDDDFCRYDVLAKKVAVSGNKVVVIYNQLSGSNYNANVIGYFISNGVCTDDFCRAVSVGNSALSTESYGIAFDGLGNVYISTGGCSVTKLNSAVNTKIWANYPFGALGWANNIIVDQNNFNVYVTGHCKKSGEDYDIITIKFNASGDSLWTRRYNGMGNGDDKGMFIAKDNLSNPNIYVTGYSIQASGKKQITSIKYDNNGNQLWSMDYGCSDNDNIPVNMFRDQNDNFYLAGFNNCNSNNEDYLTLRYCSLPGQAGLITGSTTVCAGSSQSYSINPVTGATSYVWTLPSGASGASTTNSITVNYGTSAISGDITVKGHNDCNDGAISSLAITVNPLPENAGIIGGTTILCQGQNSVTYTVPAISNATSYIWTLPTGATGTSSTNSIIVNYGLTATSGNISVKGNNSCGNGVTSSLAVTVNPLPSSAGTISGTSNVCLGQNSVSYSVPAISNATSYVWTLPTGATGASITNNIIVDFSNSAVSGNISVKGINSCGDGAASNLAITVNPLPANAGAITGTSIVCQGQNSVNYSVPTIANATSYVWTLPQGATGTSTTNSISVDYGTSAVSGNITVKGHNPCSDGSISTLVITVNAIPPTPTISLTGNVLHSDASYGNQWYDPSGFINGATNQDYTVSVNGDYYVIVTLLGCSSDASNILNVILTGIEATENNKTIKVYPNPVSNELIIEIEGNNENLNFEILNAIGQIIYKGNLVDKATVQTSNFAPGVYLIRIENGKTFEFKKIIKE